MRVGRKKKIGKKKKKPNKEPRSGLAGWFSCGCSQQNVMYRHKLRSHLPSPAPLAAGHGPKRRPGRQGTRSPRCPGTSPSTEDAAPPQTPSAFSSPRSTQGEMSFTAPHPAVPTQRSTRHLGCQNLPTALLDARSLFLRPAPAAACPRGERRAREVWLWHRPARPAARRDLPPRPTQPKLTSHSCPRGSGDAGSPLVCVPVTPSHNQGHGVKDTHPTRHSVKTYVKPASAPLTWTQRMPPVSVPSQCARTVCKFT